jgi:hypothetical protein
MPLIAAITARRCNDCVRQSTQPALIALLQQASEFANEARERATGYASKLGAELRAVENRITELEAAISYYRERARAAERWLQRIQREIENKLILAGTGGTASAARKLIGHGTSGSELPNAFWVSKGKEGEKSERKSDDRST